MRRCAGVDRRLHYSVQPVAVQHAAEADAAADLAGGDARQPGVLQLLGRTLHEGERRHHHAAGEWCECRSTAQHFGCDRGIQHAEAGAAKALRHQESGQSQLCQAVPQLGVEAVAGFGVAAQRLDRHAIG